MMPHYCIYCGLLCTNKCGDRLQDKLLVGDQTAAFTALRVGLLMFGGTPTAAKDKLTITNLNVTDSWQQLDIVDSEGKIVLSQNIKSNTTLINANISNLQKGMYFAILKGKRGSPASLRFIKH